MATQDTNFERAAPKAHRKMPPEVNILLVLVGIALLRRQAKTNAS